MNETGDPKDDEFNPALVTWRRGLYVASISGQNRLPAPEGLSPHEDNVMNHGMVDQRNGNDTDRLAFEMPLPTARLEVNCECVLQLLSGQIDDNVPGIYGGGPVSRKVPICCICQGIVDWAARNRTYAAECDWNDSIANEAAAPMGGMLCGWCRRKVCDLRHNDIYHAKSRAEYIRALLYLTSEIQAAIGRLRFIGVGVHMYIPPSWWDALNWVLGEAQQVVHRQIERLHFQFSDPREVQRAITRRALENINNLELGCYYFHSLDPVDLKNMKVWCQMEVMAEQYVADFRVHIPTQAQLAEQRKHRHWQRMYGALLRSSRAAGFG